MNATLRVAEQRIARASVTPHDAGCQKLTNVYRRTLELLLA